MIRRQNYSRDLNSRLQAKTLDQMFLNLIEEGCRCNPFTSKGILETTKNVYFPEFAKEKYVNAGQLKVIGVRVEEPPGKALKKCQMDTAIVTLDAGREDEETRIKFGPVALRQNRLCRITSEAKDQGIYLTQEDLAYKILGCDVRTIRRDIKDLASRGISVPTRGPQKDIGRGLSHRVETVRLYILRKTFTQIQKSIFHSLEAIKRYILTFGRVAFLTSEGYSPEDIAFLVQISPSLVKDYQALYKKYNTPQYKDRLEEILQLVKSKGLSQDKKRGM